MKKTALFLSITFMAGITFVNIYNSLIDANSWSSHIPESIAVVRQYYQSVNPGEFFRVFSPINQVLALLSLILFWKTSRNTKIFLGIAFVMAVSSDILTFLYFYPRNDLMMHLPLAGNSARLAVVLSQWQLMNWGRSLMVICGLICLFLALNEIYKMEVQSVKVLVD